MAFEGGIEFDRAVTAIGSARYVLTYGPKATNRQQGARWELGKQQAGQCDVLGELHAEMTGPAVEAWAASVLCGTVTNPEGVANGLVVDYLLGRPSAFVGDGVVDEATVRTY